MLYILVSILPIFPMRIDDLFVLQVWMELRLLLELVGVPRKDVLCQKVFLDSTFFLCENTAFPALSRQ